MLMWVDVGSRDPAQLPDDAGLRRAHLPGSSTPRADARLLQVPLEAGRRHASWSGTRPSRSTAPDPTSIAATSGRRSRRAPIRSTSSACRSSPGGADRFSFDILDATKIVPEELVPVRKSASWCSTATPTTSRRDRAGRVRDDEHDPGDRHQPIDPLLQGRHRSFFDTPAEPAGGPLPRIPIDSSVAQVHDDQRDGIDRPAIPRGHVAYEPDSLGGVPFQAGCAASSRSRGRCSRTGRGKPEKFADQLRRRHVSSSRARRATEKNHVVGAFRFELTEVGVEAIRDASSRCSPTSRPARAGVADGITSPSRRAPRARSDALARDTRSRRALSLTARPGEQRQDAARRAARRRRRRRRAAAHPSTPPLAAAARCRASSARASASSVRRRARRSTSR